MPRLQVNMNVIALQSIAETAGLK